jgi:flagella basal body P-ring formation protein FlgA
MEALDRERVLAALRASLPAGAGIELVEFSSGPAPKGAIEFTSSGLTPAPAASPREITVWRGRIRYAGARTAPIWARVRVWSSRTAAIAVQDLAAGARIADGDVRFEKVDVSPFSAPAPEQVLGMSLKIPVRAGNAIPAAAIESAADVSRGDKVEVEARYGAAVVRLEARAEAAGRVGDLIPVRNAGSGKTIRARVLRPGVAEVQ